MNTEIIENTLLTLINEFKKDEKEKYNTVSNTIKFIHKSFLEEEKLKTNILNEILSNITKIKEEVREEMKKIPTQFCIFDAINLQRYENYNSNLLAKFLKINIENQGTKLSFVKDFLMYLHKDKEFGWDYGLNSIEELEKINHSDISIKREEYADSRRMDLFIEYNKDNNENKFALIIENKIYASDQHNQLNDYYSYNYNKKIYKKIYIIYLTPYGIEPSENSLTSDIRNKLKDNFKTLKHSDIALWLEKILKKYSFLNDENDENEADHNNKYIKDYRLLKSAMIQTIHNANMISNNTKEFDMTKEKLKQLLEKNEVLSNIETSEEIDEYRGIFDKLNNILEERRREIITDKIKNIYTFTMNIINYFIKNDIKDYRKLSYDEIVNKMLYNGYPHNIEFNITNDTSIILESYYHKNNDTEFYFGIYTESEDSKIKIKKLSEDINKIFSRFEEDEAWVYWAYIDTEKDIPEAIADVMISLYNLLKNNL